MLVYITIGLLIAILMFTSFRLNKKIQLVSFFSIGFILFLLSAFRSGDISRDYIVYIENYKQVITNTYSYSVIEPFFVLLSKICYILTDNYLMIFFSYAFLGISIKLLAITKSSNSILASLLLYYSNYFFLHEMTQIRVGVASAIFLLSIRYIVEKKIYKYILFVLLAATFHYSALLALPLYFLNPKKLNKYHIYLMFGSALTIYLLRINITNILFLTPASGFLSKVQMYKAITDETGDKVNIFNILFLINLFFNLYLLHFKDTLAEKNKYFIILLKVNCLAYFISIIFYDFPVFSFRISEYLGVVNICLYPMIIYTIKERGPAIIFFTLLCLAILLINLFYVKLTLPYKTI